jgi:MFS superfamily sulfate permease-like transporter
MTNNNNLQWMRRVYNVQIERNFISALCPAHVTGERVIKTMVAHVEVVHYYVTECHIAILTGIFLIIVLVGDVGFFVTFVSSFLSSSCC